MISILTLTTNYPLFIHIGAFDLAVSTSTTHSYHTYLILIAMCFVGITLVTSIRSVQYIFVIFYLVHFIDSVTLHSQMNPGQPDVII